eukprot:6492788-Amphidinium_carterae.1
MFMNQAWIRDVIVPGLGVADDSCIFSDIKDIHHPRAQCSRHGKDCEVKPVAFFSAGFSCKSLSKLYGNRADMGACLPQQVGSSGDTCTQARDNKYGQLT